MYLIPQRAFIFKKKNQEKKKEKMKKDIQE